MILTLDSEIVLVFGQIVSNIERNETLPPHLQLALTATLGIPTTPIFTVQFYCIFKLFNRLLVLATFLQNLSINSLLAFYQSFVLIRRFVVFVNYYWSVKLFYTILNSSQLVQTQTFHIIHFFYSIQLNCFVITFYWLFIFLHFIIRLT